MVVFEKYLPREDQMIACQQLRIKNILSGVNIVEEPVFKGFYWFCGRRRHKPEARKGIGMNLKICIHGGTFFYLTDPINFNQPMKRTFS